MPTANIDSSYYVFRNACASRTLMCARLKTSFCTNRYKGMGIKNALKIRMANASGFITHSH